MKNKVKRHSHWNVEGRMRNSRSLAGNIFLILFLLIMGFLFFFPVIFMVTKALKPMNEMYVFPPRLLVKNPTLDNFKDLFNILANTTVPFLRYLFNSIVIVVLGSVGHIAIASMAAYALAKFKFPGSKFLSRLVVYSLMFNATVTTVPNFITISRLGLIDTLGAIIFPTFASTLGLYLMQNFMEQGPDSLIEAARIDGAGDLRIHWKLVMPIIKPAWITAFILIFQGLWVNSGASFIYREDLKNVSYLISQLSSGSVTGMGVARAGVFSAASVLMFIVPVVVFLFMQTNVISTMATSGMKD